MSVNKRAKSFYDFHSEQSRTPFVRTRVYREKQYSVFVPAFYDIETEDNFFYSDTFTHTVHWQGLTARSVLFRTPCEYRSGHSIEAHALQDIDAIAPKTRMCSNMKQIAASVSARYKDNTRSALMAVACDKYTELHDYLAQKELSYGDMQYYLRFDTERIPHAGVCLRVGGSPFGFDTAVYGFVVLDAVLTS